MTATTQGEDVFFYFDEDQGPHLTGEYNRGNSPPGDYLKQTLTHPSADSSTSGHYSSDSNMSKSKGTPSRGDVDSRASSKSPSPGRSRSGSLYRYSDSFDSEASGDSQRSSPTKSKRAGVKKKQELSAGDTLKRFGSATSRDSRSTFKTTNSSVYSKSNKTGFQKSPPKKGRGRANSLASSTQNTPRGNNVNEVARRMLSAKGHTINRLRNEYEVLKVNHEELQREFKLQKQIHRKNMRDLDKYTNQEEQLPNLLKSQSVELEHYRKKCQGYRERERQKDKKVMQYNEKLNRVEDELKRARNILENKGLKERADLQEERGALQNNLDEKESKLEELEKYIRNMKKNQRHERHEWKSHEREYKGQIEQLHMDNERLQLQLREKQKELDIRNIYSNRTVTLPGRVRLGHSPISLWAMMHHSYREKEKELDIKNIYSNRIVKPPGRLSTNMNNHTPNALRPMMTHKSTATDEIKLPSPRCPHPPETERTNSADERTTQNVRVLSLRNKSPKDERYRKKAEEQRQKSKQRTEMKGDVDEGEVVVKETEVNEGVEEEIVTKETKELDEHERIVMEFDSGVKKPSKRLEDEDENARILRQFDADSKIKGDSLRQQAEVERQREEECKQQEEMREEQNRTRDVEEEDEKKEQENQEKEKEQADFKRTNRFAESPPRKAPTRNTSEEEDNYPFFGAHPTNSAPATKKQEFAVNSVKGLQKYSASRESSPPATDDTKYNGLFKSDFTAVQDQDSKKIDEEAREAEERRKKDILLARMRQIDDGEKPDSAKSRSSYNHTEPVKNMHNGLPSHPDLAQKEKRKSMDNLTFGSYAPSFMGSGGGTKPAVKTTPKKNKFFDSDSNASPKQSPQRAVKKSNLMADLFGDGISDKSDHPSHGSFGEGNAPSSPTKAKPLADSGAYTWEKNISTQGGMVSKPKQDGEVFGARQNRAAAPQSSLSEDFGDIEEMTL